ncbi:ATP-binding cassette domain-containing protein [Salinibius halmophilus]|uniref:ATP-binding cassette domain-containing protein n=1 Tax=Salinibius halmophilus TaxID=1853216 RepID=UPI001314A934|nr:ATP-binding cassette domain-containing protein [Salinibius halmophilus]
MLTATNLAKTYQTKQSNGFWRKSSRQQVAAVKDISLTLTPGKITGLLGINGAGKTTTIKMLSGLIQPDAGSISIDGVDGIKHYQQLKRRINMVTGGERNLYWRLTAQQNLEYFGALYGLTGKACRQRVQQLLAEVEQSSMCASEVAIICTSEFANMTSF